MQPCACVQPRLPPGHLCLFLATIESGFRIPGLSPSRAAIPLPFTLFTRTPPALFRGPLHSSSQSLPDGRACWRLYYAAALNKHLYYILCSVPCRSVPFRFVSRALFRLLLTVPHFLHFFLAIHPENGHRFWL